MCLKPRTVAVAVGLAVLLVTNSNLFIGIIFICESAPLDWKREWNISPRKGNSAFKTVTERWRMGY